MNRVRGVTVALGMSLLLGGCVFGEEQVIEGYIDNAYDNRAIAHVVVGAGGERDGQPVIELTITDIDMLDDSGFDYEAGETVTVRSGGLNADEGSDLLVFLNSVPAVAYAMDPQTDLPIRGFDKPTFGGVSQEAALDCLADVYGTTGPHRREDALRADVKAEPDARHNECREKGGR